MITIGSGSSAILVETIEESRDDCVVKSCLHFIIGKVEFDDCQSVQSSLHEVRIDFQNLHPLVMLPRDEPIASYPGQWVRHHALQRVVERRFEHQSRWLLQIYRQRESRRTSIE